MFLQRWAHAQGLLNSLGLSSREQVQKIEDGWRSLSSSFARKLKVPNQLSCLNESWSTVKGNLCRYLSKCRKSKEVLACLESRDGVLRRGRAHEGGSESFRAYSWPGLFERTNISWTPGLKRQHIWPQRVYSIEKRRTSQTESFTLWLFVGLNERKLAL